MINTYECLLIFDSNRYSRDQGGVSGQIERFVRGAGGEMLASRVWEERRLAYPINGQRKGTYWLAYFKVESTHIPAIERECQLSESILRVLVLKVDARIAGELVSHALGAAQPKPRVVRPEVEAAIAEVEIPDAIDDAVV